MANLPLTELNLTLVAEKITEGYSTRQLMEHFGKNRAWVERHVAALREEWREHRLMTAEEHFDEALAKLDALEQLLWDDIRNRRNMRSAERILVLFDQRNKLKGLYAATKTEFDIGDQLAGLLTKIGEEPEPEPLALPAPQIDVVEGESKDA